MRLAVRTPSCLATTAGGWVVTECGAMRLMAVYPRVRILLKQSPTFRYTAMDR